ncbi:MAG: ADP-dependent glucokinase/phosphofructokinase [Propioniciclava sp.]
MNAAGAPGQVLLGLGNSVDCEVVWSEPILNALIASHHIGSDDLDAAAAITTERDLVRVLAAHLRVGAGGERNVASATALTAFVGRHEHRFSLGGSNVRASLVLDLFGIRSTLHLVNASATVRELLPATATWAASGSFAEDFPHLIVQFPAGAHLRLADGTEVVSPRANRVILVHDPPNEAMELAPDLGAYVARADLVLVSGLNAMKDADLLGQRLTDLRELLSGARPGAVVMYEDAGYHVPGFGALVADALVEVIDIHSLNEDELQAWLGRAVDLTDGAAVARAVTELRRRVPARNTVLHTHAWSLVRGPDAHDLRAALSGGVAAASARFLAGDAATRATLASVARTPLHPVGAAMASTLAAMAPDEVAAVPARLLRVSDPTTIGLGDAFVGGFIADLAGNQRVP